MEKTNGEDRSGDSVDTVPGTEEASEAAVSDNQADGIKIDPSQEGASEVPGPDNPGVRGDGRVAQAKPPHQLRAKGIRLIKDLSAVAWKDHFIFVGALIPIKIDLEKNSIQVDETRDGGQFTNFGEPGQIKYWLNFAANEAAMNDIATKMAGEAIDKVNTEKTDA